MEQISSFKPVSKTAWDALSMREKAGMMKVAVRNGITSLQEIRQKYNEFAEGGNIYDGRTEKSQQMRRGYVPSEAIRKRISRWEGKAMTGAVDPLSGKYGRNNSFESEARGFYNALPVSIRDRVIGNPELADNLYSYSYNVGAGNFKDRVVPALERYYAGKGNANDVASSMWATGDRKLRGLRLRRAEERNGVLGALLNDQMERIGQMVSSMSVEPEQPAFMPYDLNGLFPAVPADPAEEPDVRIPSSAELMRQQKEAERQEQRDRLQNMMNLLGAVYGDSPDNPLGSSGIFGTLGGYAYANGGNLLDGTTEDSQQMRNGKLFAANSRGDSYYLSPSALTSNELNITVPETFVTANPDDVARGNAQRWWREHSNVYHEKPLEQVSPEFDLLSLAPLGLSLAGAVKGAARRGLPKVAGKGVEQASVGNKGTYILDPDIAYRDAADARYAVKTLINSNEYKGRLEDAFRRQGKSPNNAQWEIAEMNTNLNDAALDVSQAQVFNREGEAVGGLRIKDGNGSTVKLSRNQTEHPLQFLHTGQHEFGHVTETDNVLDILSKDWGELHPNPQSYTDAAGMVNPKLKKYYSGTEENRTMALSVWADMKDRGFSKIEDYLNYLRQGKLFNDQWNRLKWLHGEDKAKKMVESVFGATPLMYLIKKEK